MHKKEISRITQSCMQARNHSDVASVTRHSNRVFFNFEKHLKRVHSEVNDYVNNVENDGAGQPTGEKPYRCSMCDKRFGLISSLETHGREKSFPCTDRLESHSSQPYGFSHMCLHGFTPAWILKCFDRVSSFVYAV